MQNAKGVFLYMISYMIKIFNENTVLGIISNSKQKHNCSVYEDDVVKNIFYAASKENYITFAFQGGSNSIFVTYYFVLPAFHSVT